MLQPFLRSAQLSANGLLTKCPETMHAEFSIGESVNAIM